MSEKKGHPSDWRWAPVQLRYRHPIPASTIQVIEPAKEDAPVRPGAHPFGFGARELAADDEDAWEGMGL